MAKKRKGKAVGRLLMGIRDRIKTVEKVEKKNIEGMLIKTVELAKKIKWRIVGVYVSEDLERKLKELGDRMKEEGGGSRILIERDFTARTEKERGEMKREKREKKKKVFKA